MLSRITILLLSLCAVTAFGRAAHAQTEPPQQVAEAVDVEFVPTLIDFVENAQQLWLPWVSTVTLQNDPASGVPNITVLPGRAGILRRAGTTELMTVAFNSGILGVFIWTADTAAFQRFDEAGLAIPGSGGTPVTSAAGLPLQRTDIGGAAIVVDKLSLLEGMENQTFVHPAFQGFFFAFALSYCGTVIIHPGMSISSPNHVPPPLPPPPGW